MSNKNDDEREHPRGSIYFGGSVEPELQAAVDYVKLLRTLVSGDEWQAIIDTASEEAAKGECYARKFLRRVWDIEERGGHA